MASTKKPRRPWIRSTKVYLPIAVVGVALLTTVGIVANSLLSTYSLTISAYLSRYSSDSNGNSATELSNEDSLAAARDLVTEVESEGVVLLENADATLPLGSGTAVNVFGYGSYAPVYGGSGSGSADESTNVTMKDGLENAGLTVNEDLWDFYADHEEDRASVNIHDLSGGDFSIYEPAVADYDDALLADAQAFSDTALVVFSRMGGEGADEPLDMADVTGGDAGKHYLELQQSEIDLLDLVEQSFGTVVVVINSSHAMELGFLEDEGVDAAIWIGGPGSTGFDAVGQVLSGDVNPSGHLVDTYAYDLTTAPSYSNVGDAQYTNDDLYPWGFVYYEEGIYVGYRYYETRFAGTDNVHDAAEEAQYQELVQYPFGYGLSYTDFDWSVTGSTLGEVGGTISVDVEVTNSGDVAGKDVVQLYSSAPYTRGGIEKSAVVLAGFAKTDLLEPGASQTVTITLDVDDLSSYDYTGAGAYVLDAGTYDLTLRTDAHTVKDGVEPIAYVVDETVVYDDEHDGARSSDEVAATNQFDEVSFGEDNVQYVSRADFAGTLPTERRTEAVASDEIVALLSDEDDPNTTGSVSVDLDADPEAEYPTTGADNGLVLSDMTGLDYDDPQWDDLLDQLSVADLTELTTRSGWHTSAISSIGKEYYTEIDGPAGLNGLVDGLSANQYATEVVLASTWNVDLSYAFGSTYGDEALTNGVSGLYAPAMNTHRSPFGGRNFEYYSEDGLLAGKMGAATISGMQDKGIYVYAKHYALNDQETNRNGVLTWANEQSIRELYLRPWEIAVKEADATGFMSGLNRIGTSWTGASRALMTTVPREEWGFQGTIITDGVPPYDLVGDDLPHYMDADYALRAGTDMMLTWSDAEATSVTTGTAYGQQVMREAVHRQLYKEANSAALTSRSAVNTVWYAAWVLLDVLLVAGVALIVLHTVRRLRRGRAGTGAAGAGAAGSGGAATA
jgi:beta-glucosidase